MPLLNHLSLLLVLAAVVVSMAIEPDRFNCEVDGDCYELDQCVEKKCARKQFCRVDGECRDPPNKCSSKGLCVRKRHPVLECTKTTDCPSGSECQGNKCVRYDSSSRSLNYACSIDAHCTNGEVCRNNWCVIRSSEEDSAVPECLTDAYCPSGSICKANKCVHSGSSSESVVQKCSKHTDCSIYGSLCVENRCVRRNYPFNVKCTFNSECPNKGMLCIDNFCWSNAVASTRDRQCRTLSDCNDRQDHCINGFCGVVTQTPRTRRSLVPFCVWRGVCF